MSAVCPGCGGPLPPKKPGCGRAPKWCSERCRKSQYRRPCVDCGALLNGSDGFGSDAPVRCRSCSSAAQHHIDFRRRKVWGQVRWHTDDMLLDALRLVAEELAEEGIKGALTKNAYDYVRAANRALPTSATIMHRFGYWADAVRRAGLQPGRPPRRSYARFTQEDCAAALREAAHDLGDIPTMGAYATWRTRRTGVPSVALIRSVRFDGWMDALNYAFPPQVREVAA